LKQLIGVHSIEVYDEIIHAGYANLQRICTQETITANSPMRRGAALHASNVSSDAKQADRLELDVVAIKAKDPDDSTRDPRTLPGESNDKGDANESPRRRRRGEGPKCLHQKQNEHNVQEANDSQLAHVYRVTHCLS